MTIQKASRSYQGRVFGVSDGGVTEDGGYLPPPKPSFYIEIRPRIVVDNDCTESQVEIYDCLFTRCFSSSYHYEYDIQISPYNTPVVFNLSNDVFLMDGLILRPQSTGSTVITSTYNGFTRTNTVSTVNYDSSRVDIFLSRLPGSLGYHAKNEIESLYSKNALSIYSSKNFLTHEYVRDPNCWLNQFSNVTAISPWNSVGGKNMGGVLISPRDALISSHYGVIGTGQVMDFVTVNNSRVSRTVDKCTLGPTSFSPDFRVVTFTEDVPNSVGFCKCLPSNWRDKIKTFNDIPLWQTDQEEKALMVHWYSEDANSRGAIPDDDCLLFYENWVLGDSGSPRGICINNELVLLTVATSGGVGSGSSLDYYRDFVNEQMLLNGSPYQLTPIDLSEFPTY